MMVGTTSTVWQKHPDFVSFDRTGLAVVDTPGERLSLDLASPAAREYYRANILSSSHNIGVPGICELLFLVRERARPQLR